MKTRNHKGRQISLLGFGLMRLPRISQGSFDIDEDASAKLIDYAIENGVNYFDSAYTYRGAEAFAGRD